MNESNIPVRWYGKEFTKKGAALTSVLMLIYTPMHEFGHWIAYAMFGVQAEFGYMVEPFAAFFVKRTEEASVAVDMFSVFFGGGFVFVVGAIIAIKCRPALLFSCFGLFQGINELVSFMMSSPTISFHEIMASNMMFYAIWPMVAIMLILVVGLPEFRSWLRS